MAFLYIDILTDDEALHAEMTKVIFPDHHSYAEQLRRAMEVDEVVTLHAPTATALPDLGSIQGVVIGGSLENSIRGTEKPWMLKTYDWIRQIIDHETPLLGICGGLQFTVRALGGEVDKNPRGQNVGTKTYRLTDEGKRDPLFAGLNETFRAQATHKCIALGLAPDWQLLATSDASPHDAIAIGSRIRLVQYHPEFSCHGFRNLVRHRALEEFAGPIDDVAGTGKQILRNFVTSFCRA